MTVEGEEQSAVEAQTTAIKIVMAFVSNNPLPAAQLPALIGSTYAAILGLSGAAIPPLEEPPTVDRPTPAQIRKSITPDTLISFIDGKPYKTLKRHLATHGFGPIGYRERYGLPDDYPMVAPNYAKVRSELAKSFGLGRPGTMAEATPARDAKSQGRRKAS